MKVVGFAGYSGSGKTTLIEQLIALLRARGQRVSVVKHAHHRFDIDQPGKDSWRHRQAGAHEVVVASDLRLALVRELPAPHEFTVHELVAELDGSADWVLVEGFKYSALPRIEVWRRAAGHPALYPNDAGILAVATDSPDALPAPPAGPVLDLNQPALVLGWLEQQAARLHYHAP